jgi:UPF0176 protein
MECVNIAAYKFIGIPAPEAWVAPLEQQCNRLELKGTIVLAQEGINLFLASTREKMDAFLNFLRNDSMFEGRFSDLVIKESICLGQPFRRMVVRVAKEIITMRHPLISPESQRAPFVEPRTLKKWLDQGHDDDGREIVMLDTRNDFEVDIGTFENAVDFRIQRFSEFPAAVSTAFGDSQEKTFVSFCTGGIRCEKAAIYMQELGLKNVYQLDGGILRYFEEVGEAHYNGECFVFDERIAVDANLQESKKSYGLDRVKTRRTSPAT